ncbi:MAG TPA: putative quinol monooxygenase [Solirubrobacterales bacterium]|nr:putative quinol monooxygenase [Solirubrobacterales bacterium]
MILAVERPSTTSPIVAVATFVPKPAAREQVRAALERVTTATHSESGCLLLALHTGPNGEFMQIGKWETFEHWQDHGEADSVQELNRAIEGLLATEREISWFQPLPVGDPDRSSI